MINRFNTIYQYLSKAHLRCRFDIDVLQRLATDANLERLHSARWLCVEISDLPFCNFQRTTEFRSLWHHRGQFDLSNFRRPAKQLQTATGFAMKY